MARRLPRPLDPRAALLLALWAAAAAVAPAAAHFSAIYTFGDSTADVGTNNYLPFFTNLTANFLPYGEHYIPGSGRFSDGRLVGDHFAELLKLPIAPPYLRPNATYVGGANFASGGSGVLNVTSAGRTIPLEEQLAQFAALLKADALTQQAHANALYFVSIGGNDYIDLVSQLAADPARVLDIPSFVTEVVTGLTSALQVLYGQGARRFLVAEVPALGCLPFASAALGGPPGGKCNPQVNAVAAAHNAALGPALAQLQQALPGSHFVFAKFFDFMVKCAEEPTLQGFKVGFAACCGGGPYRGLVKCGTMGVLNGTLVHAKLCRNVEHHVFWDSIHPTQHFYKRIAHQIWRGDTNAASPINLRALSRLA